MPVLGAVVRGAHATAAGRSFARRLMRLAHAPAEEGAHGGAHRLLLRPSVRCAHAGHAGHTPDAGPPRGGAV